MFGKFQNQVWALINSIVMEVLLYDETVYVAYPHWADKDSERIQDLAIKGLREMFPNIYYHVMDEGKSYACTVGEALERHLIWSLEMDATYGDY